MCSPSCVMAQRSRKWWEAGVWAQSRPLYGILDLFSLLSSVLLLSKSATRSEEKRTSFQVNIFTYLQWCGDIQPSVGRRDSGQPGQLKVDIWALAVAQLLTLISLSPTDKTLCIWQPHRALWTAQDFIFSANFERTYTCRTRSNIRLSSAICSEAIQGGFNTWLLSCNKFYNKDFVSRSTHKDMSSV